MLAPPRSAQQSVGQSADCNRTRARVTDGPVFAQTRDIEISAKIATLQAS
jgi:hypothetical protein